MTADYKPRLAFEISEEQRTRVNELIPIHGMLRALMSPVLDDLLDLLEKHGQVIAGLIIEKHVKPREIIPILAKAEKKAERM